MKKVTWIFSLLTFSYTSFSLPQTSGSVQDKLGGLKIRINEIKRQMNKRIFLILILMVTNVNAQWVKNGPIASLEDLGEIKKITFIDSLNGWFITNYQLFHTVNGGKSWIEQVIFSYPVYKSFTNIQSFKDGKGFLTDDNDLYFSSDMGQTWQGRATNIQTHFLSQSVGIGKTYNTLKRTIDGGQTWSDLVNFDYLSGFHFYDSFRGFVFGRMNSGDYNSIYYTDDGGLTWNLGKI